MKQNPLGKKTRRHRSVDKHENFTSSHVFWANKPAADPEKLLFPLILGCTGSDRPPKGKNPLLDIFFLTHDCSSKTTHNSFRPF